MTAPVEVRLEPWSAGDRPLLDMANTPAMTEHLGGPESAEELEERQARYLRLNASGEARMFRILADGSAAGGIGWWTTE